MSDSERNNEYDAYQKKQIELSNLYKKEKNRYLDEHIDDDSIPESSKVYFSKNRKDNVINIYKHTQDITNLKTIEDTFSNVSGREYEQEKVQEDFELSDEELVDLYLKNEEESKERQIQEEDDFSQKALQNNLQDKKNEEKSEKTKLVDKSKLKFSFDDLSNKYKLCLSKINQLSNDFRSNDIDGFDYDEEKLRNVNETDVIKIKNEFKNKIDREMFFTEDILNEYMVEYYSKLEHELKKLETIEKYFKKFLYDKKHNPDLIREKTKKDGNKKAMIWLVLVSLLFVISLVVFFLIWYFLLQ